MDQANRLNVADPPQPKAYSYSRWSTPEQGKGDSLRRQTETARRFAEQHGLELDTELTFRDEGVSAFRGRNAAEGGALAAFKTAVEEGRIARGSALIVESLDRISRQKPRRAARTLESIVELGITVLDAGDGGREYSDAALDDDPFALVMMVLRFIRANEESERKSERICAVFENKRADVASGVIEPWGNLPAWLERNEAGKPVAIPERVNTLRAIFEKAEQGWGQHRIAHWLNEQGVKPWGKANCWQRAYIRKLLNNSAVVGTYTPHVVEHVREGDIVRKGKRALDPVPGRFPAVIDPETFERVRARGAATQARGRHAGQKPASIFTGVVKCAHCGGTMVRSVKTATSIYLICTDANRRAGGCKYQPIRYHAALAAMVDNADSIVEDAPRGSSIEGIEQQITDLDVQVSDLADECDTLLREKRDGSMTAARQLAEREKDWKAAREKLRQLRVTQARLAEPYVAKRLERVRAALKAVPVDVVEANTALREAVSTIVVDPERALLTLRWRHSDNETRVPVSSRHSKQFDEKPMGEAAPGDCA